MRVWRLIDLQSRLSASVWGDAFRHTRRRDPQIGHCALIGEQTRGETRIVGPVAGLVFRQEYAVVVHWDARWVRERPFVGSDPRRVVRITLFVEDRCQGSILQKIVENRLPFSDAGV